MLTAKEAHEKSMEVININIATEIDDILKRIKWASDDGEFYIERRAMHPSTIKKLKKLGYKVKCSHGFYNISWRRPKEVSKWKR